MYAYDTLAKNSLPMTLVHILISNEQFLCSGTIHMEFEIELVINLESSWELGESCEVVSLLMLKSPKTIVRREASAIMMNPCNICKKVIGEVEWNLYNKYVQ
jgi:hypothetical protein